MGKIHPVNLWPRKLKHTSIDQWRTFWANSPTPSNVCGTSDLVIHFCICFCGHLGNRFPYWWCWSRCRLLCDHLRSRRNFCRFWLVSQDTWIKNITGTKNMNNTKITYNIYVCMYVCLCFETDDMYQLFDVRDYLSFVIKRVAEN